MSRIGRPRSVGMRLKIAVTAGVKLRMIRWRSRNTVAICVLSNRLRRSALLRSSSSTLPASSLLTVFSSSLTDCNSSLEVSSSSLVDCSSSLTDTSSSLPDFSSSSEVSYSSMVACRRSRVSRSSCSRLATSPSTGRSCCCAASSRVSGRPRSVKTIRYNGSWSPWKNGWTVSRTSCTRSSSSTSTRSRTMV